MCQRDNNRDSRRLYSLKSLIDLRENLGFSWPLKQELLLIPVKMDVTLNS